MTPQSISLRVSIVRRASYVSSEDEQNADEEAPSEDEYDSDEPRINYRKTLNPRVNTPQSREQADTATNLHILHKSQYTLMETQTSSNTIIRPRPTSTTSYPLHGKYSWIQNSNSYYCALKMWPKK